MTKPLDIDLSYHQWTVTDYHKLGEMGLLSDKRVELLFGEIINMSPIGKLHLGTVNRIASLFWELIGKKTVISVQNPIILSEHSEPEPDLTVLKWNDTHYSDVFPTAKDVLLLVEVADSTLEKDQKLKLPLYAEAGIPEYWIVNLTDQSLERYTEPSGDSYQEKQVYFQEDRLEHAWLGNIPLSKILI